MANLTSTLQQFLLGSKASDAVFWVLDAAKCHLYGDYMPPCTLENVAAGCDGFYWWRVPVLLCRFPEKDAIY